MQKNIYLYFDITDVFTPYCVLSARWRAKLPCLKINIPNALPATAIVFIHPSLPYPLQVLIWNETVANLTLMALGSSAPEILLAVVEAVTSLDDEEPADSLGTFTIIGSAAFNMLIITAVCIISVPLPQSKSIKVIDHCDVNGSISAMIYIFF